jgi:mono/diheme cytochrome c family protein
MKSYCKLFVPTFLLFLLSACSFSLAEDVTPPPGADQMPVSRTQSAPSSDTVFPLVPPNPINGQTIYTEKCAPCHGTTGQGDGPRASQLPNAVPALGSTDLARQTTPSRWFSVVTLGNLDRFMPPFPSLSDSQRWDVVTYALSLSTSTDKINQGMALYQANCARCHGELGRGDGPDVASLSKAPGNLADLAFMASKTAVDLYQAINTGKSPDMPAFGSTLSEDERWALTDYLRSLAFSTPPETTALATTPPGEIGTTPELTPTLTAIVPQGFGTITGKVTNGSGGQVPQDLRVSLHGFDDTQVVITKTTSIQGDGVFQFNNIEMVEGRVFLTTVEYAQTTYSSDIFAVPPNVNTLDLPITIYETTTDPSVIKVDRMHLFFELLDENTIRVVELYIMSNTSNKTLIPPQNGQPLIRFKLPVGSSALEFQDGALGDRYQETPDGFGDTLPVRPGAGNYQVLFAFQMPYNHKLDFVQPIMLPVDAVVILVPEGDIKVKSDMIRDDGTRNIQDTVYHLYNGGSITPGSDLRLSVTGQVGGTALSLSQSSRNNLLIGLGAFGVALLVAGIWFYRHTQLQEVDTAEIEDLADSTPSPENSETLMDAIIALDDLYQAGELPEEAYRKRRDKLKKRLSQAMEPPISD